MIQPHSSNLRVITTNFLGVRIFRKFTVWYNVLVSEQDDYDADNDTENSNRDTDQNAQGLILGGTPTTFCVFICKKHKDVAVLSYHDSMQ